MRDPGTLEVNGGHTSRPLSTQPFPTMHALFRWVLAFRHFFSGPPLTGARLVVPLPPFLAGPGAHVEIGLQGHWPALRIVRPAGLWPVPVRRDPWDDPDADLGPHDTFARF